MTKSQKRINLGHGHGTAPTILQIIIISKARIKSIDTDKGEINEL